MKMRNSIVLIAVVAVVAATWACSSPVSPTTSTTTEETTTTQDAPTVTAVEPAIGSVDGGTTVTITGTNFLNVTAVAFGSASTTLYTVVSDTSISVITPSGSPGVVDVVVTTAGGASAVVDGAQFTWDPNALTSLTLSRTDLYGGGKLYGTLTLKYPAPSVGVAVSLTWRSTPANIAAVVVPTSVSVPAGETEVSFPISTYYVSAPLEVEIVAEHWGEQRATFILRAGVP